MASSDGAGLKGDCGNIVPVRADESYETLGRETGKVLFIKERKRCVGEFLFESREELTVFKWKKKNLANSLRIEI